MGTENPKQTPQAHQAEQRDELPIPDLDLEVDPGKENSENIRGGTDDNEANSEKIRRIR